MKKAMLKSILKRAIYPAAFMVRSFRSYRQLANWRKYIVDGYITVAPVVPKGIFKIDIRSHLSRIIFSGKYEPEVMNFLSRVRIEEGLVVNIGANVGFYTVHLASLFPRSPIVAVEPNPEAFSLLTENIQLNNLSERVRAVNCCIGSYAGKASLSFIPGKPEYSSMKNIVHSEVTKDARHSISVDCARLIDVVGDEKVFLVVIDVEGAEQIVLESGRDVLLRDHPTIVFEISDQLLRNFGSSSSELIGYFEALGYSVRKLDGTECRSSSSYEGNLVACFDPRF